MFFFLFNCNFYLISEHYFFYAVYNPVIVTGTNYYVLWNDFHIKVYFMFKWDNSSLP